MTIELKVPAVGESIQEVQIAQWVKRIGDTVQADETIVELDTDKASVEIPAPAAGVISQILKKDGEQVAVGEVIGYLEPGNGAAGEKPDTQRREQPAQPTKGAEPNGPPTSDARSEGSAKPQPKTELTSDSTDDAAHQRTSRPPLTPAARRELRKHGLSPDDIEGGHDRLRREDVLRMVESGSATGGQKPQETPASRPPTAPAAPAAAPSAASNEALEEVVPMSLIRRRIAQRLVEAQQRAALLTTFNEADMSGIMSLRKTHGEKFLAKYGTKLGFMAFFVKASVDALKQFPAINAEIRDDNKIVYRNYYHIGIAIGGGRGLVVPVLRHAENMSFAEIELAIGEFAKRAEKNKIEPHELEGGTFTISNGGVYGSLLSTPIVNPPQSGVLGMHSIQERPIAHQGQVVIRPMMYLALTYDHRIVDGREAVSFLRRLKEALEDPSRMLLEI